MCILDRLVPFMLECVTSKVPPVLLKCHNLLVSRSSLQILRTDLSNFVVASSSCLSLFRGIMI